MGEHTDSELGAFIRDDGVTFRVWAPFATSVSVSGSFNNWSRTDNAMEREENGYWTAHVGGATIGQEYHYIIHNGDRELQRNDPRALQLTTSGDASLIVDPNFNWEDDTFTIAPRGEQVVYELHIGTFNRNDPATPGTFATAIEKLDYLADLGINVLEVLPVSNVTSDRWWGYEPDHLYAIETAYGGHKAFLELVKAAHDRGIGVVVDVVYNHLSGTNLWQFDGWNENSKGGIYYYNDWRAKTPWGETRPDYGRPEIRNYISDNVKMWLSTCHIDGLRVDAAHYIRNVMGNNNDPNNDIPEGWQLLQDITRTARAINPEALLIAEDLASNEFVTMHQDQGGAGFSAQWETSFPYAMRDVLEPINDADRNLEIIERALAKNYNGDVFQRIVYSESHDADANGRARMNEEIAPGAADNVFARRRSTIAAAIALTAPGTPMLFQGQEFMEYGYFNHWQALDWNKTEEFKGILQLYKDLIALRRNADQVTRGLQGQSYKTLHFDKTTKMLAYHRWDQGGPADDVVVIVNFTNEQRNGYSVNFPRPGSWKIRLNSDWRGYSQDFGNTPTPDVIVEKVTGLLNVGPYSVLILSQDD